MMIYIKYAAFLGALLAVFTDLSTGKIYNLLCGVFFTAGLFLNYFSKGVQSLPLSFSGALVPLLILLPVFIFRMIGGGDIKLLMALGSIMGAHDILISIFVTFFLGSAMSLIILLYDGSVQTRFSHLFDFAVKLTKDIRNTRPPGSRPPPDTDNHRMIKKSYIVYGKRPENIHLSVPILMSVMLYAGGIL